MTPRKTPVNITFTDFEGVVAEVPQLRRGRVWCTVCDNMQDVNSAQALRNGWPKCCGYTMTIDSPLERAARSK